jgi:hypothetical protein
VLFGCAIALAFLFSKGLAWTAAKYRRFNRGERMPKDWKAPGRYAIG